MRSRNHGTSVPPSRLDNAFSPAYLAHLREQDETLTAAPTGLWIQGVDETWGSRPRLDAVAPSGLKRKHSFQEGRAVTMLAQGDEALVKLLPAEEAELLAALDEADREEGIPAEELFARLRRFG